MSTTRTASGRCSARGWLPGLALILALLAAGAGPLAAQRGSSDVRGEVFAGSEIERYLRVLQLEGETPRYPWSIRGFSLQELDRLAPAPDSLHPWAARYTLTRGADRAWEWHWVHPEAQALYNSAFPYGINDGPLWVGRGLTTALQAGFAARRGPLSLVVAPIVFRAENAPFELAPTGASGRLLYADPRRPKGIDLPQRFGEGAYTRIDPGQSTLRADAAGLALGASTANEVWGPASEYPMILGANAPGFAHLFAGTAHPANVWIGRVHARMIWGRLEQSEYSPAEGPKSRRFMSGIVGVFTPRGVPGLELGGTRFFHAVWPEAGLGLGHLAKPLEGILKSSLDEGKSEADNQLASVFFRWVLPRNGMEVYGEYGREDHNWDLRDLLLEPDHDSGYTLGFRKGWRPDPERIWVLRGEVLNSRITHLAQVRGEGPFYVHSQIRQGHTHRGQILGSPAAYGGSGASVALDRYTPGGRWSLAWSSMLRQERALANLSAAMRDAPLADVQHALAVEALLFSGPLDVTGSVAGVYEFNRDYGGDAFNLNLGVRVRWAR